MQKRSRTTWGDELVGHKASAEMPVTSSLAVQLGPASLPPSAPVMEAAPVKVRCLGRFDHVQGVLVGMLREHKIWLACRRWTGGPSASSILLSKWPTLLSRKQWEKQRCRPKHWPTCPGTLAGCCTASLHSLSHAVYTPSEELASVFSTSCIWSEALACALIPAEGIVHGCAGVPHQ